MKLAVFVPNWVGDVVMATPALRAIRERFRDARIDAVLRPYVGEVLDGLDLVDGRILWNPRGSDAAQRGWRLISRLRRERFDTAVLLTNSLRSAALCRLAGIPRRVGFRRDGRGWLLTDALRPHPRNIPNPVLDEYLRLAEHLGADVGSRQLETRTQPDDRERIESLLSNFPAAASALPLVTLNPGGAFGAAKHWPTGSFRELAARLAGSGARVLVLCGPAERLQTEEIVSGANSPLVQGLHRQYVSLGLTKAAIEASQLLITTDSGPRHFAAALNVPVVTLFGPTHTAWSETYFSRAIHVQLELDCGPCQQRTCPLGHHRCMRDLTVDHVMSAARQALDWNPPREAAA